jgi:hypothetical protein
MLIVVSRKIFFDAFSPVWKLYVFAGITLSDNLRIHGHHSAFGIGHPIIRRVRNKLLSMITLHQLQWTTVCSQMRQFDSQGSQLCEQMMFSPESGH